MKLNGLCFLMSATVLVGCVSFSTNLFRTEQTAVGTAYAAYQGYTNGLASGAISPSVTESNNIRTARLDFAASVGVVEAMRASLGTNSSASIQTAAQAALNTLLNNSSNVVWLINRIEGKN